MIKPSYSCVSCLSEMRTVDGEVLHNVGCEHLDASGAPFLLPGYVDASITVTIPPLPITNHTTGLSSGLTTVGYSVSVYLTRCTQCAALVDQQNQHFHSESHTRLKRALYELQRRTNRIRKRVKI